MSITNLRKISNGKTVFYNSAFSSNNELVRTGIDTENSFYHSLLLAYAENYSDSSTEERNDMVSRFIESISKKITEENWEQLNSKYRLVSYDSDFLSFLDSFYEYIETRRKPDNQMVQNLIDKLHIGSNFDLYEAIFELVSLSNCKESLKLTNRNSDSLSHSGDLRSISFESYRKTFISNIISILNSSREFKAIDKEKKNYILNILNTFFVAFFKELGKHLLVQFKTNMTSVESKVNPFLLSTISKRFKRDIYFINGSNKLPYSVEQSETKSRKSLVLIRIDNSFEPIGRVLDNKQIGYEFDSNDNFISKLKTFILQPQNISRMYPELASLLPNTKPNKKSPRNLYYSDSDSEEEKTEIDTRHEESTVRETRDRQEISSREPPVKPPVREPPVRESRPSARGESKSKESTRDRNEASARESDYKFRFQPRNQREELLESLQDLVYHSSSDESN